MGKRRVLQVSGLCFLAFLVVLFSLPFLGFIDEFVFTYVSGFDGVLFGFFQVISFFGSVFFLVPVWFLTAFVVYKWFPYRGRFLLLSLFGVIINPIVKLLVQRPRPPGVDVISYSFPSGHVFHSLLVIGVLAFVLWDTWPKTARFLLVLPFFIGISRVFLGVHWLSDVFAGLFLSLSWLLFSIALENRRR